MADTSMKTLLRDLISEISQLIRQELRLAQAEVAEKSHQIQEGAFSVAAGLLMAFAALIILLQAVVVALSKVVEPWLATVIVGVVTALIAFFLIRHGQSRLVPGNLMPRRTMKSVRDDVHMMSEKTQ